MAGKGGSEDRILELVIQKLFSNSSTHRYTNNVEKLFHRDWLIDIKYAIPLHRLYISFSDMKILHVEEMSYEKYFKINNRITKFICEPIPITRSNYINLTFSHRLENSSKFHNTGSGTPHKWNISLEDVIAWDKSGRCMLINLHTTEETTRLFYQFEL